MRHYRRNEKQNWNLAIREKNREFSAAQYTYCGYLLPHVCHVKLFWAPLFHASVFSYQKWDSILFLGLRMYEKQSGTDHGLTDVLYEKSQQEKNLHNSEKCFLNILARVRHPSLDWPIAYHTIYWYLINALSNVPDQTRRYPRSPEVESCSRVVYNPTQ